ncbi:MAG: DoxX family protein, partial [Taibaiella sp.]|nr:DoxX family protein [Taibaiella sp.]
GYPAYMLYILGIAKLLGAIGLLQPVSPRLREWAYAGLAITFIGATWSHVATATPFIGPMIFLVILAVSWVFNSKLVKAKV